MLTQTGMTCFHLVLLHCKTWGSFQFDQLQLLELALLLMLRPFPSGNHFFLFVWSEISSHIIQSDRVKARSFIPGLTWDAEYRGRSGWGRCDRWRRCWSRSPGTPGPPGRRPSLETVCPAHRYLQQTEAPMSRAALPSLVGDSKSNRGLEWSGSDSWSPEDQKSTADRTNINTNYRKHLFSWTKRACRIQGKMIKYDEGFKCL